MKKLYRDILKILTDDCRYTPAKIAVMLGVSETEVSDAIRDMEEQKMIVKYTAILNNEKIEPAKVQALIEIKVTPQKNRGFDAIAEEIYKFDEVVSVFLLSGGFDLSVLIDGNTLREVAMFVSERLSTLPTVISTSTHFVLKKYKVEGVVIEEMNTPKRIAFQP